MKLGELFRASVYALAALGAVAFSFAEGTSAYGGATVLTAVAAYFVCDRWKWGVPVWAANLLALGALGVVVGELVSGGPEERLLAGAHLLVYLQLLLLVQEKQERHYWQVIVLSLLQLAVATLLTSSGVLGALMVAYLFVGTWTLAVAVLRREWEAYAGLERLAGAVDRSAAQQASAERGGMRRRRPRAALGAFGGIGVFEVGGGAGQFFSAVSRDGRGRLVSPGFVLGVGSLSTAALALGVVLFLFVPRIRTGWAGESDGPGLRAVTGYSGEVELGEMSSILESQERVMQVSFWDVGEERRLDAEAIESDGWLGGEPLFRGVVLSSYRNGRWTQGGGDLMVHRPGVESRIREGRRLLRQEVELEPVGRSQGTLLAVAPVRALYVDEDLLDSAAEREDAVFTDRARSFFLTESLRGRRVRYRVYTPIGSADGGRLREVNRALYGEQYLGLPREELPRLRAETARATAGVASGDALGRARALERWLQERGGFTYSLSAPARGDGDPIEDFMAAREGHCEYFAAALALMLRIDPTPEDGVDDRIPSRLVVGYKGGEWNSLGGFYEVQQRHAHAWVEAYIPGATGAWVTLDPTPAAGRSQAVASSAPARGWLHELATFFGHLWSSYVTGLDSGRQHSRIFRPLGEFFSDLLRPAAVLVRRVPELLESVWAIVADPERWFSLQGGLTVLVIGVGGVAGYRVVRVLVRRFRGRPVEARLRGVRTGAPVRFYERLVKLLGRRGLTRAAPRTPLEFGLEASALLALEPAGREIAGVPPQVVVAYYGVRFGGESLGAEQAAEIDRALDRLESAVAERRTVSGRGG